MYKLYILKSDNFGKYYIGHTQNLNKRLNSHNSGLSVYTKKYLPWSVVYIEDYKTRSEAIRREKQVKSYKGGEAFRKLIEK